MSFQKPVVLFIASAAMAGCGGSSAPEQLDPLSIEAYPLLQQYYGLDQDDLDSIASLSSLLMAQKTTQPTSLTGLQSDQTDEYAVSLEKVKTAVLGAGVYTQNSSFNNFPIFDIGNLKKDNLYQENFSSMTETQSIDMKTQTTGESNSTVFKSRAAASYSGIGFHGQITAEGEYNFQEMRNQGGTSVVFRREVFSSQPTISLTTKIGSRELDYSPYLVGTSFTPQEIAEIIKPTKCQNLKGDPAGGYICKVAIDEFIIDSIVPNNPYQRIQVLNELIRTLDTLRAQRSALSSNDKRRDEMLASMILIRDSIRQLIETFYLIHGQAFISSLYTMADATGVGTIKWSDVTGNESRRWAVGVTAGYSSLVNAVSGGLDLSGLTSKGWAESFQNVKVTATSNPATFTNVSEWVTKIEASLKAAASSKPTVPAADMSKVPFVTAPDPAKLKEPLLPPKGTYSNLNEWVAAREYLKNPEKNKEILRDQANWVKQNLLDKPAQDKPAQALKSTTSVANSSEQSLDYDKLTEEIDRFNNVQKNLTALRTGLRGSGNNLISVDGHYVSGFDLTKYEDVLPQLRPNLSIEGETPEAADYYPNATRLRMLTSRVQDAALYIRFLSNIEDVSGVNTQIADKFESFSKIFTKEVFNNLKKMTLSGKDVPSDVVESVIDKMVGNSESRKKSNQLLTSAENEDLYRYFRETILTPKAAEIWAEGSGGFIPFTFQRNPNAKSKGLTFFDVRGIKYNQKNQPEIDSRLNLTFSNPETNPLELYRDSKLYPELKSVPLQSPWYPVFRYNRNKPSSLLYVQFAGAEKIIYGKQYVVIPSSKDAKSFEFRSVPQNLNARLSEKMMELISSPSNSFMTNDDPYLALSIYGGIANFSIKFPNTTASQDLYERYKALLMIINPRITPQITVSQAYDNGYQALPWQDGYKNFAVQGDNFDVDTGPYLINSRLQNINTCNSDFRFQYMCPNARYMVLLPIGKQSVGDDFQKSFRWSASYKIDEMIKERDYDLFNSIKFLHMNVKK